MHSQLRTDLGRRSYLKQSQPNAQPQQPIQPQHEVRLNEAHAFFPQKSCRTPNQNAFRRIDNIRVGRVARASSEHFDASSDRHLARYDEVPAKPSGGTADGIC
jgi:hypothetical protein